MSGKGILLATALSALAPVARAADKPLLIELERGSGARPNGMSASGSVAVGGLEVGGFYWMPTTGVVFIGGLGASSVSADGSTIVGSALDSNGVIQAAIWQRAAEWRLLGSFRPGAASCDRSLSSANDTSRDGTVVVGLAWDGCTISRAFRWDEAGGMVDLGSSVAGKGSRADGVSADGRVVVGHQVDATGTQQGAQWVDGRQELFTGPYGIVGTAKAANRDGSIVVGRVCRFDTGRPTDPGLQSGWVWTRQEGITCLAAPALRPSPGPVIIGDARATSDDGRVIGGSQNVGGSDDSNAVIWIDRVPYDLKEYLQARGVPDAFATWVNTGTIVDVSPDGRVLVGTGAALEGFRGYVVILGDER
jgi:probable HAF family extracellular repeat protein